MGQTAVPEFLGKADLPGQPGGGFGHLVMFSLLTYTLVATQEYV